MAKGFLGAYGYKAYLGAIKMRKGYIGTTRVYSAGNVVAYHVDTGITYQEEVDEGESCLSPKSFTPEKSGWTFVGWRSDGTTNPNCYSSYMMGDNPVTLYAVFRQEVTVTYYDTSQTAQVVSGYRYYNNGTVKDPSFAITQAGISGWEARGWSTSAAANAGITYGNGASFTRDSNVTLYGMYQQTITVTYYNGNRTALSTSGIRYYCPGSGNVLNPSFALTQAGISGWTARGWSTSAAANAGITYGNGASFTRDSNVTLYGMYYQTITLTTYNGSSSPTYHGGTRYYCPGSGSVVNPTFAVSPAALSGWSFNGWCTSSGATAGISYSSISGLELTDSLTLYGRYSKTVTLSYSGNGATGGAVASQGGTCYYNSSGAIAGATFILAANGFSRPVYNFVNWALGGASGAQYAVGTGVTITGDTVMYAVWTKASEYYILRNGNLLDTEAAIDHSPSTIWAGQSSITGKDGYLITAYAVIGTHDKATQQQYLLNIKAKSQGFSKFELSMYNSNSAGMDITFAAYGWKDDKASSVGSVLASKLISSTGGAVEKEVIYGNMAGMVTVQFQIVLNAAISIYGGGKINFGFVDIRFYD